MTSGGKQDCSRVAKVQMQTQEECENARMQRGRPSLLHRPNDPEGTLLGTQG